MIQLEVEEYCHNCPEFKADVDMEDYGYKIGNEYVLQTTTTVGCKSAKRCRAIFDYFMKSYDVYPKPVMEAKEN